VKASFGENPAISNFESMTRTNMELFDKAMRMFSPFVGSTEKETPKEEAEKSSSDTGDLDELKKQLAQMQEQLSKIAGDKDA